MEAINHQIYCWKIKRKAAIICIAVRTRQTWHRAWDQRRHASAAPATPVFLIQHTPCVLLSSAHGVSRKSWLRGPGVHPPACLVANFRASASGWDDLRRRTTSAARSSDLKFVLSRLGGIPASRITLAFSTSPSSCSELSSFFVCLVALRDGLRRQTRESSIPYSNIYPRATKYPRKCHHTRDIYLCFDTVEGTRLSKSRLFSWDTVQQNSKI